MDDVMDIDPNGMKSELKDAGGLPALDIDAPEIEGEREYCRWSVANCPPTGGSKRPCEVVPKSCALRASFSLLSSSFWYLKRSISSDCSLFCSFCACSRFLRCSFLLRPVSIVSFGG
jgi:hypothetical protein